MQEITKLRECPLKPFPASLAEAPAQFGDVLHALGEAGQGVCGQVAGWFNDALKQHAPECKQAR